VISSHKGCLAFVDCLLFEQHINKPFILKDT